MTVLAGIVSFIVGAWDFIWPIASTIIVIVGSIWGLIKAWPQIRRAFQVSDTVATLPELIEGLRADVKAVKAQTQALEEKSDRKERKLEVIEADLAGMKEATEARLTEWTGWRKQMDGIYAELTHNGGLSIKDSISRLELKVNGYEQLPGETLRESVVRMRNIMGAAGHGTAPGPIVVPIGVPLQIVALPNADNTPEA